MPEAPCEEEATPSKESHQTLLRLQAPRGRPTTDLHARPSQHTIRTHVRTDRGTGVAAHLSNDGVNLIGRHELVLPQPRPTHSVLVHHGALVGAAAPSLWARRLSLGWRCCARDDAQTELHVEVRHPPPFSQQTEHAHYGVQDTRTLALPHPSRNASRCNVASRSGDSSDIPSSTTSGTDAVRTTVACGGMRCSAATH
jgi:hypothetical protein